MEECRSPFLRQLGHCLQDIFIEFKDDLQDVCAGDQHLVREITADWDASCPSKKGSRPSLERMLRKTRRKEMSAHSLPRSRQPAASSLPRSTSQNLIPEAEPVRKLSWAVS